MFCHFTPVVHPVAHPTISSATCSAICCMDNISDEIIYRIVLLDVQTWRGCLALFGRLMCDRRWQKAARKKFLLMNFGDNILSFGSFSKGKLPQMSITGLCGVDYEGKIYPDSFSAAKNYTKNRTMFYIRDDQLLFSAAKICSSIYEKIYNSDAADIDGVENKCLPVQHNSSNVAGYCAIKMLSLPRDEKKTYLFICCDGRVRLYYVLPRGNVRKKKIVLIVRDEEDDLCIVVSQFGFRLYFSVHLTIPPEYQLVKD